MDWQTVYKLPLKARISGLKVFTADNVMAFDFVFGPLANIIEGSIRTLSESDRNNVVDLVNGTKKGTVEGIILYNKEEGTITIDGNAIILIRGWGHLTGSGGLNLPPKRAAAIQDGFANYIVEKLTGK